jgi:hypothetical protein
MQATTLQKAIQEAERFLELAKAVPIKDYPAELHVRSIGWSCVETGKASGAARRASMDLSRELANLRCNR